MSTYNSDRYGFRNQDSLWEKEIDVLAIGDSFMMGNCVSEGHNISEVFNKLSKYKMLNLGIPARGPLMELATLKEYFKEVKNPKYVFWFYYEGNDLINLKKEFQNKILVKYLEKNFSQKLPKKQKIIDDLFKESLLNEHEKNKFRLDKFIKLSKTNSLIVNLYNRENNLISEKNLKKEKEQLKNLKKVFIELNNFIEEKDLEIYLIYIPSFERYLIQDNNSNLFLKNDVINLINQFNFKLVDLDTELMSIQKDYSIYYPFKMNNHPNIEGYKLISEYLYFKFKKSINY